MDGWIEEIHSERCHLGAVTQILRHCIQILAQSDMRRVMLVARKPDLVDRQRRAEQRQIALQVVDKVFFVVRCKDLDCQTMRKYQHLSPHRMNGDARTHRT